MDQVSQKPKQRTKRAKESTNLCCRKLAKSARSGIQTSPTPQRTPFPLRSTTPWLTLESLAVPVVLLLIVESGMDFLTTNFPEERLDQLQGFPLMDLPLEILYKVLIFLDIPDLVNLGKTCRYLKQVSNERFVMRCRLWYTRDRLNLKLMLRPDVGSLYEKHIIPTRDLSAHPEVVSTAHMLEKNLRRDSLSKSLRKRPSLSELKDRGIMKRKPDGVVQEIKTQYQKRELSEMLKLLLNSWRYQSAKAELLEPPEFVEVYDRVLSKKKVAKVTQEVSDDDDDNGSTPTTPITPVRIFSGGSTSSAGSPPIDPCVASAAVQTRRQFFEELAMRERREQEQQRCVSAPDQVLRHIEAGCRQGPMHRPSRTVLKALVSDSVIRYEKV